MTSSTPSEFSGSKSPASAGIDDIAQAKAALEQEREVHPTTKLINEAINRPESNKVDPSRVLERGLDF